MRFHAVSQGFIRFCNVWSLQGNYIGAFSEYRGDWEWSVETFMRRLLDLASSLCLPIRFVAALEERNQRPRFAKRVQRRGIAMGTAAVKTGLRGRCAVSAMLTGRRELCGELRVCHTHTTSNWQTNAQFLLKLRAGDLSAPASTACTLST